MIKSIYNLFKNNILEKIEEIKYVGLFVDQFNREKTSRVINYPAILIEILPFQLENLLGNTQHSIVSVKLHVATQLFNTQDYDDSMIDESVEFLSIIDKIKDKLTNLSSFADPIFVDNKYIVIGVTDCNNIEINIPHENLYYCNLTFKTSVGIGLKEDTTSYLEVNSIPITINNNI